MGCFLACFGGGGDRRRRKSRARLPTRPDHVAAVGKASSAPADVAVKEGASPPLSEARALAPPPVLFAEIAAEEAVTAASPGKEQRESSEQKTLTVPTVDVAEEGVAGASPGRELRQLSENKESPAGSLPREKIVTPPLSPVKCSPVAAAVVSAPDMEPRDGGEEDSRSGGKKKVTFDMNVTTYEDTSLPDEEGELSEPVKCMKDEDAEHMHKSVLLPENHRYGNCADSDDDSGDGYGEDDNYDDDDDDDDDSEAEEDFVDCKIDQCWNLGGNYI